MEVNKIYQGDALQVLKTFPDNSIDCCITSPPYWNLRDYEVEGQLGLEKTPEEYVNKLVEVYREVKRVLKKEGTCWLNLGDSYVGGGRDCDTPKQKSNRGTNGMPKGLKQKDLVGIPWRVAFALQANGWWLRQDIIWLKPNPMPELVTDRCTKAHEYIFLLAKSQKYYFDNEAIKEPITDSSAIRLLQDIENQKGSNRVPGKTNGPMKAVFPAGWSKDKKDHTSKEWNIEKNRKNFNKNMGGGGQSFLNHSGYRKDSGSYMISPMRNKRSVWTVTTQPYKEAHFATFPKKLIEPMVKAGCPKDGIVLDPFIGSGTTAIVARELQRNYIGIELNAKYIKLCNKRLAQKFIWDC